MRGSILAAVLALGLGLPCAPPLADSSSPLLAAYYDRFMAISSGFTYTWVGDGAPSAVGKNVRQVGVGRGKYYALTNDGVLWGSRRIGAHGEMLGDVLMRDVTRLSAGRTGVLAIRNDGGLWCRAADAAVAQKIADDVVHAAVGDSANYYVTSSGARAIATGSSHSLAIRRDGTLMAWGAGYGPDPVAVMENVSAVAAGASATIALQHDGSLWQWARGQATPRKLLPR